MTKEIYFSVDVESDGPVPGLNSMLSIGISALHPVTLEECGLYYATLERLPGATQNADTMKWWEGFPEQYAMATHLPDAPLSVMLDIDEWVRSLAAKHDCKPVFVAYPAAFDFCFFAYYAHRFVGNCCFGFVALDMGSVGMGFNGAPYNDQTKKKWPDNWVRPEDRVTLHDAIADARQQATIFRRMMASLQEKTKLVDRLKKSVLHLHGRAHEPAWRDDHVRMLMNFRETVEILEGER